MMRSRYLLLGVLVAPLFLAGTLPAVDTFTLGFTGPDSLSGGTAGQIKAADFTATLAQTLEDPGVAVGAQGWSISMTADGAAITAVTTAGTMAAPAASGGLQNGGFEKTELTNASKAGSDCEGKNGAVSAIVLSFTMPITLDPAVVSTLAIVTAESQIPATPETPASFTLRYANGCQGAGQPVDNKVTQSGATREPVKVAKVVDLILVPSCIDAELTAGFTAAAVTGAGDVTTFVGTEGAGGSIAIETNLDATPVADAFAGIASKLDPAGAQGWSLAVALEGEGTLTGATTAGTTAAPAPGGLQSGGFEKTEIVDPAKEPTGGPLKGLGPQGQGAVSAIVLSFTQPITLPPVGVESVLKLTVEGAGPQTETVTTARLYLKNGLQGAGQPVNSVVTVAGATNSFCNVRTADVTLAFGPSLTKFFRRGDPNDDVKLNIADPIYLINALFRSGPPVTCEDTADANDDGQLDATDAVFLIDYLFRAGTAPSGVPGECVEDTTEDSLACAADSSGCD